VSVWSVGTTGDATSDGAVFLRGSGGSGRLCVSCLHCTGSTKVSHTDTTDDCFIQSRESFIQSVESFIQSPDCVNCRQHYHCRCDGNDDSIDFVRYTHL